MKNLFDQGFELTNLHESPEYIQKTLELIHESFEYKKEFSFDIDFYSLFNENNFHHCFILIKGSEVVAHIGLKERLLGGLQVNLWGGICVASKYRAKGIFSSFFDYLLYSSKNSTSYLWSDDIDLYQKFNFNPFGIQYTFEQKERSTSIAYQKVVFDDLDQKDKNAIKLLFNAKKKEILMFKRSEEDWQELYKTKSIDLYIFKDKEIKSYFLKNKGMDLNGYIHEYSYNSKKQFFSMLHYGHIIGSDLEEKYIKHVKKTHMALVRQKKGSNQDISNIWINGHDSI
jgi:hypothetical protein